MLFELAAIVLPLFFLLGFSDQSRFLWQEDHSIGFIRIISGTITQVEDIRALNPGFFDSMSVHSYLLADREVAKILHTHPAPCDYIPRIAAMFPPPPEVCESHVEFHEDVDGDEDGWFEIRFWQCTVCEAIWEEEQEPDIESYIEQSRVERDGGEYL